MHVPEEIYRMDPNPSSLALRRMLWALQERSQQSDDHCPDDFYVQTKTKGNI